MNELGLKISTHIFVTMLIRNHKGILIEINRADFASDEDFYAAIMKEVIGKNITCKKEYIVNTLVEKATKNSSRRR